MVTKEQCIAAGDWMATGDKTFHYTGKHDCTRIVGSRGGVTTRITQVRANGKCQVWKTRPNEFRLPVKYGLYEYGEITHENASDWHVASECPLNHEETQE